MANSQYLNSFLCNDHPISYDTLFSNCTGTSNFKTHFKKTNCGIRSSFSVTYIPVTILRMLEELLEGTDTVNVCPQVDTVYDCTVQWRLIFIVWFTLNVITKISRVRYDTVRTESSFASIISTSFKKLHTYFYSREKNRSTLVGRFCTWHVYVECIQVSGRKVDEKRFAFVCI